jgi:superfamily I DNA/RNA helicase
VSEVSAEIDAMTPTVHSEAQQRVLRHRAGPLLVLGAAGTGKTTLLVELVAACIDEGLEADRALLLTSSRRAGVEMRDRVAARVGRTIREPLARTAHSYAFGLLRRHAARRGELLPRLLAGAEQEVMIREMLATPSVAWPESLRRALGTRVFASQLRDFMPRVLERGLTPDDLARLGEAYERQLWTAVASFIDEYAGVTALAHPSAYDPAELVRAAVDLLRDDADLLAAERLDRRLVVVDDVDEADPALLDMLEVLAGGGTTLVATADPDSTVYGFRGADPRAVREFSRRFAQADGAPAPEVVLDVCHRLPAPLLAAGVRVAARLGGSGAWRHPVPGRGAGGGAQVQVRVLASGFDEWAHVAATLRRRHLLAGVPWHDMAVVLRSAGDLAVARRALARHGVPVAQRTDEVALWQQAPVRALLDLLALVCDDEPSPDETVLDLLLGPLGELDPARWSRLRRSLLVAERQQGGTRSPEHVVFEAVAHATVLPVGDRAVQALADTVQKARATAADGSVEQVLWALWDGVGVAQRWRATALAGQRDAAAADRDLDAVVGLFDAAAAFTDRMPGAGAEAFLDHVRAQQLPGDSWSTDAPVHDAVAVLTAHACKGREWDTVAVCRVHDDLWPDLRRRQSLLGVDELVAVVDSGRLPTSSEQASALLAGERRLFHLAVTRARAHLLVTATDDGETRPSRFVDELDPQASDDRTVEPNADVLNLPHLVAELRAAACTPSSTEVERAEAARLLARLAGCDVPGADPDSWFGLVPATDDAPLFATDDVVTLSPSQIEGYLRCPLRWLLQRAGGENGTALRQSIGMLVHDLAFEAAEHGWGPEQVRDRYEHMWAAIDAGRGWVARRERARADDMVDRLVAWMRDNPRELVGVEVEVSTEVAGATVRGRLDRVDRDADGGLVVVDFKTGASAPTKADVERNPQLGVYQWAVRSGGLAVEGDEPPPVRGGLLVHLGLPDTPTAKQQLQPALDDADDPTWPQTLVAEVVAGVRRPVFAALVNAGCGHCPVRSSCPAHPDGGLLVP